MSDFYLDVGILRGQFVDALIDNDEQFVWVLGEITDRANAERLATEFEVFNHDHDPVKVADFWLEFSQHIRAQAEVSS